MVIDDVIEQTVKETRLTPSYLMLMAMSGILTAISFLNNSIPILLGAIIIAPILPPLELIGFAIAGKKINLPLREL